MIQRLKLVLLIIALLIFVTLFICCSPKNDGSKKASLENEIIYHTFLRSFYDSNGDRHGDLNGLREKLDYLQELGVTSVLLTPLYYSDFYHNYFPIDFEKIDTEFGTKEDYFALLSEMHRRGMKLFMDMEIHYVTEDHLWYKDSYQNPASIYSEYIIYNGPDNTDPEPMIYNLTELQSYDGKIIKCCTTDLYNKNVRDYHYQLFKYWVDPDEDGNFNDGIDGFRLDHIMDDLDWKGKITGLLENFWKPLFVRLREINPDIVFIGEQADWGYGEDYYIKGDLNCLFAFPLSQSIRKFDAEDIKNKIDTTCLVTPINKYQLIFTENHDMPRVATALERDVPKMKIAATLNLLLKGVPVIYYGQEIGMTGANGFGKYGSTDGNDIPVREAFEWYTKVEGQGMALWYKETGPWWNESNLKSDDGISLEEQKFSPNSLWNYYKQLITVRKENSAISSGEYHEIVNNNIDLISFSRSNEHQDIIIIMNLNENEQEANLDLSGLAKIKTYNRIFDLMKENYLETARLENQYLKLQIKGYTINVLKLQ